MDKHYQGIKKIGIICSKGAQKVGIWNPYLRERGITPVYLSDFINRNVFVISDYDERCAIVEKVTNKNSTHGMLSNFVFMMREQWSFEKKTILVWFIRIISDLIVAMSGIYFPKVVLDSIGKSISPSEFIMRIGLMTVVLMAFQFTGFFTEQSVIIGAIKILNIRFYIGKDWKALDMDYGIAVSKEGKIKIEKAHSSINRNVQVNMASYYINLVEFLKSVVGLLSFSTVILLLNPVVILILLVTYMIDGMVAVKVRKWEVSIKDERAVISRRLGYVLDDISNALMAKDIKIYKMMNWINDSTDKYIGQSKELEQRVQRRYTGQQLAEVVLTFLRNGAAYLYLIWKMFHSDMTIGDFTLYFGAITGFGQWLSQIVGRIGNLSNANYRVDDYRYLAEMKDHMKREGGVEIPNADKPCELKFEDVCYRYEGSDHDTLHHINLVIHPGEKLAIVGNNGAGKTTFIKLACGLLEPTEGRIYFNGIDIREFNRDDYYKMMSASFQNVCILPMSIATNIGCDQEENMDQEKMKYAIDLSGLSEKIESLPNGVETGLVSSVVRGGIDLSGGEKQKLMLARAIYKEAPLIVLDEPTAALDPIAEQEMYLKYNNLTKNRTAIYISHRLSSTRFCDRIILLDGGNIAEMGNHEELMKLLGKYRKLFDVQSQYYKNNDIYGEFFFACASLRAKGTNNT